VMTMVLRTVAPLQAANWARWNRQRRARRPPRRRAPTSRRPRSAARSNDDSCTCSPLAPFQGAPPHCARATILRSWEILSKDNQCPPRAFFRAAARRIQREPLLRETAPRLIFKQPLEVGPDLTLHQRRSGSDCWTCASRAIRAGPWRRWTSTTARFPAASSRPRRRARAWRR